MEVIIVILNIILFFNISIINAAPPHPNLLNKLDNRNNITFINKENDMDILSKDMLLSKIQSMKNRNMNRADKAFPAIGNRKVIVLLGAFSNKTFSSRSTITNSVIAFYHKLLNGFTDSDISLRRYYKDMSLSKLNLTFDIKGPFIVSKSNSYYGENDSSGYDKYVATFVGEVVRLAISNGVDFSSYDNDGDSYVDTVIVIHAGTGEEASGRRDDIWSHQWTLSAGKNYGDGDGVIYQNNKKINNYTLQPEYVYEPGDSTIGILAHEFGHVLGLPDLYDTSQETHGVGPWSLMSEGCWNGPNKLGERPAPLLAWEKKFLGWATEEIFDWTALTYGSNSNNINLIPFVFLSLFILIGIILFIKKKIKLAFTSLIFFVIFSCSLFDEDFFTFLFSQYKDYTINLNNNNKFLNVKLIEGQYYLIEYIKKNDPWNSYLPGEGVLISHIFDYFCSGLRLTNNQVNYTKSQPHGVNIIESDGKNLLWDKYSQAGRAEDLWTTNSIKLKSGISNNQSFYYSSISSVNYRTPSGISIEILQMNDNEAKVRCYK